MDATWTQTEKENPHFNLVISSVINIFFFLAILKLIIKNISI